MRVKAPAERNFRRPRGKPSRRKRLRPRVSWTFVRRVLSVLLLVFGVYQTVAFAFTTPLLRVNRIVVRGNVRLSNGEVQALLEDLRGTSILQIDLGLVRQRLAESPWVAEVALRRVLPATIEVFISERRPIGLCRLGQELYLVDETGVVIDEFGPQYAEFDLPIVDGLVGAPPRRGSPPAEIDPRRAELASRVIAALARNQEVGARLSQVDVTDPHDAVVLLDGDTALLHLGTDKFLERVQSYLELSSTLRERVAEIDYVDLRFDQRVYVRPTGTQRRSGTIPRAGAPVSRQF
jgi:cell division protein FtsQ